jgi:hypothetical protein
VVRGHVLACVLLSGLVVLLAVAPASAQNPGGVPTNDFLQAPLEAAQGIILDAMKRVVPVAMFIMSVLVGTQLVVRLIRTVLH